MQTAQNVDRRNLLGEGESVAGQGAALTQESERRFGNLCMNRGKEAYLVRIVLHLRDLKRIIHIH